MKIGIISDTHDQLDKIKKAVSIFKKEKVVLVYHLGDICSPFSLTLFKDLPCSMKAVFGNNDSDIFKLMSYKPGNVEFFDKFYMDEFNGKKIALIHGDPEELVVGVFESGRYDLLLRGHSHIAGINKNDRTLMINPGSLIGPTNEHKGWTKPSIAVYDFEKNVARIIRL